MQEVTIPVIADFEKIVVIEIDCMLRALAVVTVFRDLFCLSYEVSAGPKMSGPTVSSLNVQVFSLAEISSMIPEILAVGALDFSVRLCYFIFRSNTCRLC